MKQSTHPRTLNFHKPVFGKQTLVEGLMFRFAETPEGDFLVTRTPKRGETILTSMVPRANIISFVYEAETKPEAPARKKSAKADDPA